MLFQLITEHPEAIPAILQRTPAWVWALAAALAAVGIRQMFDRPARLNRVLILPAAMAGFALFGIASAFGVPGQSASLLAGVFGAWLAAAALTVSALSALPAPAGTRYDAARRELFLPGSAVPLALIAGVFLTRYAVGVEIALQPHIPRDPGFALSVAGLYGVFNGLFAARAAALWRLTRRTPATPRAALT